MRQELLTRRHPVSRAEIDQQVVDGLQAAWDANAAFNRRSAITARRERYAGDLVPGDAPIIFKIDFITSLAEAAQRPSPFAKYDAQIEAQEKEFNDADANVGENIGRGSVAGMFFHKSTRGPKGWEFILPSAEYKREFNEGVVFAHRANEAYDRGDKEAFANYNSEAGKRLGRDTESGILEDFRVNTHFPIEPEGGRTFGETFNDAMIERAAHCMDESRTSRLVSLRARVRKMRAEVREMTREVTYALSWRDRHPRPSQGEADLVLNEELRRAQEADAYDWFSRNIIEGDYPATE